MPSHQHHDYLWLVVLKCLFSNFNATGKTYEATVYTRSKANQQNITSNHIITIDSIILSFIDSNY